jgi:hypothetical protein
MANESGGGDPLAGKKIVGEFFKKAVSLGAGAYVSAEDKVSKTLSSVQLPKDFLKEALENFLENYSIQVQADIKFVPKKKKKDSDKESDHDK